MQDQEGAVMHRNEARVPPQRSFTHLLLLSLHCYPLLSLHCSSMSNRPCLGQGSADAAK